MTEVAGARFLQHTASCKNADVSFLLQIQHKDSIILLGDAASVTILRQVNVAVFFVLWIDDSQRRKVAAARQKLVMFNISLVSY